MLVEAKLECLTSESVQSTSLPFQSIDDIHGGDGLPLGMLGVGDSIPDHVLQEDLQHAPGLLIDEATDPLDATSACQASDGRLGNPLNVVTQHLIQIKMKSISMFLKYNTLRCLLAPALPRALPPLPWPDMFRY